jgi:nucleotide-binding universal stress UspA family protein
MADRLFTEIDAIGARVGVKLDRYWSPGKPSDVILSYLEERGAMNDVVVMGAYGRAWLREKIFGSTTESVLQLATVPVLLST